MPIVKLKNSRRKASTPATATAPYEFIGIGEDINHRGSSASSPKFVILRIVANKENPVRVLSLGEIARNSRDVLSRLANDIPLLSGGTQREFICAVEAYHSHCLASGVPLLRVATRLGLSAGVFVLPDIRIPAMDGDLYTCFDGLPQRFLERYCCAGTKAGWNKLAGYAIGNTRLMFAFALAFVGATCSVWQRQSVAFQITGSGGVAKSPPGIVSSAAWGWRHDLRTADQYGFGDCWSTTVNGLEDLCRAYNHTFLYLDDTSRNDNGVKGSYREILKAIMKLDDGQAKGRLTDHGPAVIWSMSILSTSNASTVEMAREAGYRSFAQYTDRMIDICKPNGCESMFETCHECADIVEFVGKIKKLASENHGHAGREFVRRLMTAHHSNNPMLVAALDARAKTFTLHARVIRSVGRDLSRVIDKFATVYASGCLAIAFGVLPFTQAQLLDAVLTCLRDHVEFVERESHKSADDEEDSLRRLCAHVDAHGAMFVDLDEGVPKHEVDGEVLGYKKTTNGRLEILLPTSLFDKIAGDRNRGMRLRQRLANEHRIATGRAGAGPARHVVKRVIGTVNGEERRESVVAVFAELFTPPASTKQFP